MSLADSVLGGDRRAAARLLRDIDDAVAGTDEELRTLYPRTGKAQFVGVTGTPGAGKSTLCDRLIAAWRRMGKTVGVLAVDPTSPFTGGAILGDRVRMQDHALDKGVFIRSLATRGNLGGLSRATWDSARVLDAFGCDVVIIETVGVGQDEVEIAQLAHTTLLVTVPGLGDDVQAIKAGVLEIADIFVVNKADRDGADRTIRDLRMMLELRRPAPADTWEPPIVSCIATRDEGTDVLVERIGRHWDHISATGERLARETARARADVLQRVQARLLARALRTFEAGETRLDLLAERIARRELDPYTAVDRVTQSVIAAGEP